jgi:diaminopimelate decarboxylase
MQRIDHEDVAAERIARTVEQCVALGTGSVRLRPAYSVKTNPDARILAAARRHGFRAEVIGADELAWVERLGFEPEQIIYNGPEPIPPRPNGDPIAYCFADSIEAWERCVSLKSAQITGIRLRPSGITSRFGVPPAEDDRLCTAVTSAAPPAIAVSMHVRRQDYGSATWLDLCDDLIARGRTLEGRSGAAVVAFDVGGGWEPWQFDTFFERDARALVTRLQSGLPRVRELVLEPGQAIATPFASLETTVLEVRRRSGHIEAIIDAGYNDWPQQHSFPHRISWYRDGVWQQLDAGNDRIGGRTCLEYDCIDGIALPRDVRAGDRLRIGDVGAYDASMAFRFGRGG